MTIWHPELQIAAGHNNAAGLTAIEGITPAGTETFFPVTNYGSYIRGDRLIRTDTLDTYIGFNEVTWFWRIVTWLQAEYLEDTYCGGSTTGLVTVRTQLDRRSTYANYNATLKLPDVDTLTRDSRSGGTFRDYTMRFVKLVAL